MTFQPAPLKKASSSWMILPLPRTGPSETLQVAVDDEGQGCPGAAEASLSIPRDSGSSICRR